MQRLSNPARPKSQVGALGSGSPIRLSFASIPKKAGRTRGLKRFGGGYTLLELMVAMALCGLAVSLVFYSWNYISKHTIVQQRKTMFEADADRIAKSIASELRRSPEVITLNAGNAVFLAPNGADTITYAFTNGILSRNNAPLSFTTPRGYVTQFSIEKERSNTEDPDSKTALITLTVAMADSFGDSRLIPLKVKVAFQEKREDFVTHKWNY